HHSGKRGGVARLQYRLAGDDRQCDERPGPRLSRRCAPAARRKDSDVDTERPQRPVRQAVRTESGMSLLNLFRRRGSAPVARERLQVLLAYERATRDQPNLLAVLREEIMAVITKHVAVEQDNIQVRMDRRDNTSTIEIEVEIPNSSRAVLAAAS